MSKIITIYGLIWSGTGCFIAAPIWQQRASNGWKKDNVVHSRNYDF